MVLNLKDKEETRSGKGFNLSLFGLLDGEKESKNAEVFKRIAEEIDKTKNAGEALKKELGNLTTAGKELGHKIVDAGGGADKVSRSFNEASQSATKMTFASKAAAVGMKALSMAGNMIIMFLVSEAISMVTKALGAAKQATEDAIQSFDELNDSLDSLDDYKSKLVDLRKELDFGNLSYEDAYNKRKELIELQDELIKKYGKEAEGIDFVTGSIQDQEAAIDSLIDSENRKWQRENQIAINNAEKYITGHKESNTSFNPALSNMSDEALDYIRKTVEDFGGKYAQFNLANHYNTKPINAVIAFDKKTVEEQIEIYSNLFDTIEQYGRDTGENVETALNSISETIKKIGNETYQNNKKIFDKNIELEVQTNDSYKNIYKDIVSAKEDYYSAVSADDTEKIKASLSKILSAKELFNNSNIDDENIAQYFNDMFEDIEKQTAKHRLKLDFEVNQDGFAEKVNNLFSDLNNITDSLKQETAYAALSDIADEYGMSLENLIKLYDEINGKGGALSSLPLTPLSDTLKDLNSEMTTLSTAWNEMEESQQLSIQTVQALIEADSSWLSLLQVESGQIKFNKDLMVEAAKAKIKAKIDETKAIIENTKLEIEAFAASNAAYMAVLEGRAGLGVKMYTDGMGVDDTKFQEDQKKYATATKSLKVLENLLQSMNGTDPFGSFSSSSKSSSSKGTDAWKEQFNEFYKELQYLRDKHFISEEEYYNRLNALNDKYFKNRKEYLDDYRKYELEAENGLLKIWEDRMKAQGDAYNERIDKEIKKLNEQKKIEEAFYDRKIEALQEQKDALSEQYTEEEKILAIEEKREALIKAQTQRNSLVYKDGKFEYMADQSAVDSAQKDFDNANKDFERYQIEKELDEQIKKYEDAKKHAVNCIDSQIEKWEALKETVTEQLSQIGTGLEEHQEDVELVAEIERMFTDGASAGYNNLASAVANYVDTYISKMEELKAYREYAKEASRTSSLPRYARGRIGGKAETAIVDEYNNPEIIARKVNGRFVRLEYGDSVIPANISKKVIEAMNQNAFNSIRSNFLDKSLQPNVNLNAIIPQQQPQPNLTIGDIKIINPVGSSDGLALEIKNNFSATMKQMLYRK